MGNTIGISEMDLAESRNRFFNEAGTAVADQPFDSSVMSAFFIASASRYNSSSTYAQLLDDFLLGEAITHPSYRVRKWYKDHQTFYVDTELGTERGFPLMHTDPRAWREDIDTYFTDPESPTYQKLKSLLHETLNTSRPERSKILAFTLGCLASRWAGVDKELGVVHDYGAANNGVLKALAYPVPLDFKTVIEDSSGRPSLGYTRLFRDVCSRAILRKGIGIEKDAAPDLSKNTAIAEEKLRILKGRTLDPHQFAAASGDATYEELFDTVQRMSPSQVSLIHDNFRSPSDRTRHRLTRSPADVAFFSHSLLSNDPSEALQIAGDFMHPLGKILVSGYVELGDDVQQLRTRQYWYQQPWSRSTFMYDLRRPSQGWVNLFDWKYSDLSVGRVRDPRNLRALLSRGVVDEYLDSAA